MSTDHSTSHTETTIIEIPQLSISAPESKVGSKLASPKGKRQQVSASLPTSPRAIAKKNWLLVKRESLAVPRSPGRALRKHTYGASFGKMPRSDSKPSLCPVHSYSEPLTTLKRSGVASFGTTPLTRSNSKPSLCPVHSYLDPLTTLKRSGVASFGTTPLMRSNSKPSLCPVHSYSDVSRSTLKHSGSPAFSKDMRERSVVQGSGPGVHSYASPASTLARTGATAFSKAGSERGPILTQGPDVHSYVAPTSTLRKSGAVAFGGTASRDTLTAMSRTGLVTAVSTPNLHERVAAGRGMPRGPLEAARHARKVAAATANTTKLAPRAVSPTAVEDALALEGGDASCAGLAPAVC